jgi:hypothetical protein
LYCLVFGFSVYSNGSTFSHGNQPNITELILVKKDFVSECFSTSFLTFLGFQVMLSSTPLGLLHGYMLSFYPCEGNSLYRALFWFDVTLVACMQEEGLNMKLRSVMMTRVPVVIDVLL